MTAYLAVAIGAVLGANTRYWVSVLVAHRYGVAFPYGTLVVNVSGSFLLGVAYSAAARDAGLTGSAELFVTTGLLGAFTTFSTFSYETVALLRQGSQWPAVANVAGTTLAGIAAGAAGLALGNLLA